MIAPGGREKLAEVISSVCKKKRLFTKQCRANEIKSIVYKCTSFRAGLADGHAETAGQIALCGPSSIRLLTAN